MNPSLRFDACERDAIDGGLPNLCDLMESWLSSAPEGV
jgi:hypothetical protein